MSESCDPSVTLIRFYDRMSHVKVTLNHLGDFSLSVTKYHKGEGKDTGNQFKAQKNVRARKGYRLYLPVSQPTEFAFSFSLDLAFCLMHACGHTAKLQSTFNSVSPSMMPVMSHASPFHMPRLLQHQYVPLPQSSADYWHGQLSSLFSACCVIASSGAAALFFCEISGCHI